MSSRLIVNSIRHTGASSDAISLDSSGNVTCNGTATGFGGGKLVNYGSVIKTDSFSASVAQGAFSSNCIELSYTAASTSNKLLIMVNLTIGYQHSQSVRMRFDIGGSTVDSVTGDASGNRTRTTTEAFLSSQNQMSNMSFNFIHSSPATSATTYGCQIGAKDNSTQTVYLNSCLLYTSPSPRD